MATLEDFHANGVSFPDVTRADIDELVERIPSDGTLHLAILRPPYLDRIVAGTKTIESRFNSKRAAPFGTVAVGDLVLLKGTGKPITNYFFASAVHSINLTEEPLEEVRRQHGEGIHADNEEAFWRDRASSIYATLVEIGERGPVLPMAVVKKDQRGWVTFARDEAR